MELTILASGSNGNSCLIESSNTSILIDAGKSGREIEKRMNILGKSLENVDALLLSHSHTDHICGAGIISRRFDIPVFGLANTLFEAKKILGRFDSKEFELGSTFKINELWIKSVETSHDVLSTGFAIGNFGIFTDTGIVTSQIKDILPKLNTILIETNYDEDMLLTGSYPAFLKKRISSDKGHLSNVVSCDLISNYSLSKVFLGHLSENNNTPSIVKKEIETRVPSIDYEICSRDKETGSWRI